MGDDDEAAVRSELARLREEHRDLDTAIAAIQETRPGATLQIQRLKRKKLVLKDRITFLEDKLTPDIIA